MTRGRKPSEKTLRKREAAATLAARGPFTVLVSDRRGRVVRHDNVPADWTRADVLERFGIAEHLHVTVMEKDGSTYTIQSGSA